MKQAPYAQWVVTACWRPLSAPPPPRHATPRQLLELASLLHAYGLVSAVTAFPPSAPCHSPSAPLSPDSKRQVARQRQKSAPKLNPDGSVRLNARQRRTLRRAQERAMKALLDAQTKVHGISAEQVGGALGDVRGGRGGGRGGGTSPIPLPAHPPAPVPRRPPHT